MNTNTQYVEENAVADNLAKDTRVPPDKIKKIGRKLKTLPAMAMVSPYIMKTRNTSSNLIKDTLVTDKIDEYIREKKNQGLENFTLMHVLIAAYIRTVASKPGINRYIQGQRVFARNNVEVCLTIKKEMTLESPDTVVKAYFYPDATAEDVYNELNRVVKEYRDNPGGDFDETVKFLRYLPGLVLKFAVWVLNLLDYFGLLPRFLTKISPFHGSFFITSMGSLGIPPVYHHLYDFGNVPIFMSFGVKRREYILNEEGQREKHSFVDYTVVTDERICDGYYFASALKQLKRYAKNPWKLDEKPDEVIEDIL